jgi:hypothetical protein
LANGQTQGLLRCALANATALGLDDAQIAALARMHWGEAPSIGSVAAMVAVMSETQFRDTVSRFIEALQNQQPDDTEAIKNAVAGAIETRIKDRAFVETELATTAAEKLLGWTKLFATFVALPVGLLLLILSLVGISKFEDLRKVSDQADALVTRARGKLEEGGAEFDRIKESIDKLTNQLNSSQAALDKQLAQVKDVTASNETKIGQLAGSVNNLTGSVTGLQSASTALLLGASGKSVAELQSKLKELGLFHGEPDGNVGASTVEAVKAFQEKNGLLVDGAVGPQTRALLFK